MTLWSGRAADPLLPVDSDSDEYQLRIGRMKALGCRRAVIMPVNKYLRPNGQSDTAKINDVVAAYRDAHPEHFPVAVGITEPLHGEPGLEEIERIDTELGMVGVSYHTRWQGVSTDDEWVVRGLDLMARRRMLPFIHAYAESFMETPVMVARLAATFPKLPIVVMDALSTNAQAMQFMDYAERLENLYFDTSCARNGGRLIKRWVDQLGPSRLIFGSDTYSTHVVTVNTPEVITSCGISAAAAERILRDNLTELLAWTGRWPRSVP
jgi:uncharacterized protein